MTTTKRAAKPAAKSTARAPLGHTESLLIKMHPDIKTFIEAQAAKNYCSAAEYVRQLIITDMRLEAEVS